MFTTSLNNVCHCGRYQCNKIIFICRIMCKMYTKIQDTKLTPHSWWHHWALLAVITQGHMRMARVMMASPGPLHICQLARAEKWSSGSSYHQNTTSYKEMKTGVHDCYWGVVSSLMDVARCEILVWADMTWGNIGAIDQVTSWGQGLPPSNVDILQVWYPGHDFRCSSHLTLFSHLYCLPSDSCFSQFLLFIVQFVLVI